MICTVGWDARPTARTGGGGGVYVVLSSASVGLSITASTCAYMQFHAPVRSSTAVMKSHALCRRICCQRHSTRTVYTGHCQPCTRGRLQHNKTRMPVVATSRIDCKPSLMPGI